MAEPLDELRDSLTGDLLVEGDHEYERARLCFNLLIDRRPAAIARCVDGNDVAAALAFGQARGLEIAIRSIPRTGSQLARAAPLGSTSTPRLKHTALSRPAA